MLYIYSSNDSKRRRCGPKARPPDGKRPRNGVNEDDYNSAMSSIEDHSPMTNGDRGNIIAGISSTNIPLDGLLPVTHRGVGFNAPMTADGLSGLVGELINPALGDGEGSGSSSGNGSRSGSAGGRASNAEDLRLPQTAPAPAHSTCHYSQSPSNAGITNNVIPFLPGGTSPTHPGTSPTHPGAIINNGPSSTLTATNAVDPSPAGSGIDRQLSLRSTRRLTSSQSAPISTALPPRDLPTKSASMTSRQFADAVESGRINDWEQVRSKSPTSQQTSLSRGPLPMTLGERPKAHLRTFMRSMGSIVLLPGTEALREAMNVEVRESTSADAFDPMQVSEPDGGKGVEEDNTRVTIANEDQDVQDALTEARQAEAWAAIAVGALFSGAGEEEAKKFVSKALRSLGQCLDSCLPEVRK